MCDPVLMHLSNNSHLPHKNKTHPWVPQPLNHTKPLNPPSNRIASDCSGKYWILSLCTCSRDIWSCPFCLWSSQRTNNRNPSSAGGTKEATQRSRKTSSRRVSKVKWLCRTESWDDTIQETEIWKTLLRLRLPVQQSLLPPGGEGVYCINTDERKKVKWFKGCSQNWFREIRQSEGSLYGRPMWVLQ